MPLCKDIHTRDPGRPVKTATATLPLSMHHYVEMGRLDCKECEILDTFHTVLRTTKWSLTYEHQHWTALGNMQTTQCKELTSVSSLASMVNLTWIP